MTLQSAAIGGTILVALVLAILFWLRAGQRRVALDRHPLWVGTTIVAALIVGYQVGAWAGFWPGSWLRFHQPYLTFLAPLALAFGGWRTAMSPRQLRGGRKHAADALQAVAMLAVGLAAAEPEVGLPLDRLTVVVAIDRSLSIDLVDRADERLRRELELAEIDMGKRDRIGQVVFGSTAATRQLPRHRDDTAPSQEVSVGRQATDIASAIRRALADIPADSAGRVVIVSDGVDNRGDAPNAAAAAKAAGVPIDTVLLEQEIHSDVRVVDVRTSPRAALGETLEIRTAIHAPARTKVALRLSRDGVLIQEGLVSIEAGESVVRLTDKATDAGVHQYSVELTADVVALDHFPDNNTGSAFVKIRGPSQALVIDGDGQTAVVAESLEAAGFEVTQGNGALLPATVAGLARYDLIVFGDIAAQDLGPERLEAMQAYVTHLGGGLLLVGGDRSFGPGGYSGTPIEDVAPVSFDLKQDRRRASLAEVIAIDISGSMGATVGKHTKLELANEAAVRSMRLLGAGDQLGVVDVDTRPLWAQPLAPITDKAAIEKAIRKVGPGGGGIDVDVALEAAYKTLLPVKANLKHVLLFADGSDAQNITPTVKGWTATALGSGITTSTVSLGRGMHTPGLEELSRVGGGRFYLVEDAARLPAVFTQETIAATRAAVVQKSFQVALTGANKATRQIDWAAAPSLEGYVVTIPKGRSNVLLTGIEGDPVLAQWSAGIGKCAVFTSDFKARWGTAFGAWPGATRLIGQLGRLLARRDDDHRVRVRATVAGGELKVQATAVDDEGRLESFRRLHANVVGPGGRSFSIPLKPTGKGLYSAGHLITRPGAYMVGVHDTVSKSLLSTTGAALTRGLELRPTGSNRSRMALIASLSGGRVRDSLSGVFLDRQKRRFSYEAIATWLAFGGAVCLLLAVAVRRLQLPPIRWPFGNSARRTPARAVRSSTTHRLAARLAERRRSLQRTPTTGAPAKNSGPNERSARRPTASPNAPIPSDLNSNDLNPNHLGTNFRPNAGGRASPPTTPKTAAEILLERRRKKRRSGQ